MAKGMSMEEFRASLESDARNENERLKIEIAALKEKTSKEIEDLKNDLEKHKEWCRSLGNRCFMYTSGLTCHYCAVSCCRYALTDADWEQIRAYMRKNNSVPESTQDNIRLANFVRDLQRKKTFA